MKYIIIAGVFLLGAAAGYLVCDYWDTVPVIENFEKPQIVETMSDNTENGTAAESSNTTTTLREPIPLRNLPLTDSQKKTAETFGIDVETFVITPAMFTCAEAKLGASRLDAVIGGSSLSFTESMSLMTCLGA